ncbi:hypothetical protein RFI_21811 [Reticulomyxa filosa]|uniref:Uncharacterized protein n=1 Tax=Reticulomyxa filosa TaxID=46433 RepID=X6MNH3_RETFI|nr:hypothetical protein RFI_21811 [Reticulomyxa filosa]|eukprot:ETO15553.1 hypothetical protein RFI_21811 [Reticulomyxa filosa]
MFCLNLFFLFNMFIFFPKISEILIFNEAVNIIVDVIIKINNFYVENYSRKVESIIPFCNGTHHTLLLTQLVKKKVSLVEPTSTAKKQLNRLNITLAVQSNIFFNALMGLHSISITSLKLWYYHIFLFVVLSLKLLSFYNPLTFGMSQKKKMITTNQNMVNFAYFKASRYSKKNGGKKSSPISDLKMLSKLTKKTKPINKYVLCRSCFVSVMKKTILKNKNE